MEIFFVTMGIVLEIVVIILYLTRSNVLLEDAPDVHTESEIEIVSEESEYSGLENSKKTRFLFGKTAFYAMMIVLAICFAIAAVMLHGNVANYANYFKLMFLLGVVATAAIVDFKKKIIPNAIILVGLIARGIIYIVEYFVYNDIFFAQLKTDVLGFLLGFGVFFITALVTKGAVGFGDVKLFGVIGLTSGAICTYSTMFFCLIVSSVVSIILLVFKKKNKKDSIPFGPCIFAGYFISLLLSNY